MTRDGPQFPKDDPLRSLREVPDELPGLFILRTLDTMLKGYGVLAPDSVEVYGRQFDPLASMMHTVGASQEWSPEYDKVAEELAIPPEQRLDIMTIRKTYACVAASRMAETLARHHAPQPRPLMPFLLALAFPELYAKPASVGSEPLLTRNP